MEIPWHGRPLPVCVSIPVEINENPLFKKDFGRLAAAATYSPIHLRKKGGRHNVETMERPICLLIHAHTHTQVTDSMLLKVK
jgi:hypothetical protein